MSIEITSTGVNVSALMMGIAKGVTDELGRRVLEGAQYVAGVIRKTVTSTFPDGRTGGLARSYHETFIGWKGDDSVSAAAESALVYARILDEGGTILPKSGKYLAIPVPERNISAGKWPRHWGKDQLTFIKSKSGKALLATVSKKGKVVPQYFLVQQSTIRARNYLAASAKASEEGVAEIIGKGIDKAIGDAEGAQP